MMFLPVGRLQPSLSQTAVLPPALGCRRRLAGSCVLCQGSKAVIIWTWNPSTACGKKFSHSLVFLFYPNHFIARSIIPVPSSSSSASHMFVGIRTSISRFSRRRRIATSAKVYRLQFPVSTSPNAQTDHERRTCSLQAPPEEIYRKSAGINRCGDEMEEVYSKCKIRDEL